MIFANSVHDFLRVTTIAIILFAAKGDTFQNFYRDANLTNLEHMEKNM
jgi:hypothetical protein